MTPAPARPLIDLIRLLLPAKPPITVFLHIGTPPGPVCLPCSFYGPMDAATAITSCTLGGTPCTSIAVMGSPPFAYWSAYFATAPTGTQTLVVQGNDGSSDSRTYTVNRCAAVPVPEGFEQPRVAAEMVFPGQRPGARPGPGRASLTFYGPLRRGADGRPLPVPLWVPGRADLEVGGPLTAGLKVADLRAGLNKLQARPVDAPPGRWLLRLTGVKPGTPTLRVAAGKALEEVPLEIATSEARPGRAARGEK